MAESDSYRVVSRRKRGKRPPQNITGIRIPSNSQQSEFSFDYFNRKLNGAKDELDISEFKNHIVDRLKESLEILHVTSLCDIICYGLGNFTEHVSSKFQLALLLILKDLFHAKVYIYDPIFSQHEIEFLKTLNLHVIEANEEGKRIVECTSLLFLPHCPKQLMNNFLYANWNINLKNCIIFANSFKKILESHTDHILRNTANYIVRISPFTTEIEIMNNFRNLFVFSDLSLHIFTEENLNKVSNAIWIEKEEPKYAEKDVEFVTSLISEKLKIESLQS